MSDTPTTPQQTTPVNPNALIQNVAYSP